jgi:hypothetical protein
MSGGRDIVGARTNQRGEATYLYRLNTPAQNTRRLFLVHLERINELSDRPSSILSNSCTVNIIRYANAARREGRFDIRHLFNGLIDSYLYHSGRVDTSLPFDEIAAALADQRCRARGRRRPRFFAAPSGKSANTFALNAPLPFFNARRARQTYYN